MKLIFLFLLFLIPFESFATSQLGDRLVVAINNSPYTQRQVEVHILMKESLRVSRQNVRLMSPSDWGDALQVFTEDMIIFQESLRLGSFQPSSQILDQFIEIVNGHKAKDAGYAGELKRLGVDEKDVASALETILRIEGFRKSKNRQAKLTTNTDDENAQTTKWFSDLQERTVVRFFDGAKDYKRIASVW